MNRIYARSVLANVTGEKYTFEDTETLDRMAIELEKACQAGADAANQDAVPRRMRTMWDEYGLKLHLIPLINVRVLELIDNGSGEEMPTRYIAVRLRQNYRSEPDWDFGNYQKTIEGAVVEAIAMRKDPRDVIDGQYANKLLGLE